MLAAAVIAVESVLFYAVILYGNALFLIPKLYWKGKKTLYVVVSIIALLIVTVARLLCEYYASKYLLKGEKMPSNHLGAFFYDLFYDILIFIVGIIFRLSLDYFRISKQQEELKKRTAEAELNLLKSQVQPHFLFNTLNNIYFVAQRESPATAELLERLSNIMRYFVDEGPKHFIALSTEISFLKDYIELERVRMRHPLRVEFYANSNLDSLQVPPMLMLPLVENVFKHGINKRRDDNMIEVNIINNNGVLEVDVRNKINFDSTEIKPGGNGLKNLRARLELLYNGRFTFKTEQQGDVFKAHLTIPL
jgi:LytS/YehU family sensor histidine kinase